jgi:hypothetical protein
MKTMFFIHVGCNAMSSRQGKNTMNFASWKRVWFASATFLEVACNRGQNTFSAGREIWVQLRFLEA